MRGARPIESQVVHGGEAADDIGIQIAIDWLEGLSPVAGTFQGPNIRRGGTNFTREGQVSTSDDKRFPSRLKSIRSGYNSGR